MIINLKSQTDLSGLYIIYEGSTLLEHKGIYGISHALEHLVCKAFDDLNDDFDRDGISWNAYTESNLINFHFTGLEESLLKYRKKIFDRIFKFDVTKEQFEIERNIVLSEYGDYFNDQAYAHHMNLNRKLFNDYDPIGLRKDLENLKFMDCINYFEKQYMNPSKIINVSKKFKLNDIPVDFAKREIVTNIERGNHDVDFELMGEFKDKSSLSMVSNVINEDFAKVNLLNSMISMGLQSPLYQEIREKKGLVYYIHMYQTRHNMQGVNHIATLTSNKNVPGVIDGVTKVLKDKDKFLNKTRLNLVKDYTYNKIKKNEILRYSNVDKYLTPEEFQIESILDTVKLSDLGDIYDKHFNIEDYYISNDKKEFK
jgi:predicted Zn-dependent peptidase